jgi:hypothetical protein
MLFDILITNIAYSARHPQAASIVGNRLPLDIDIGSTDIDAFYVKGILQNGDIARDRRVGIRAADQRAPRSRWRHQGISTIPISGKPATLQILQYQ